jgi:hypothetical protein
MKKYIFILSILFVVSNAFSQNTGDTIIVQTFIHDAWTDGNGNSTGSGERDTVAYFPNNPNLTFEKIIMSYNMRCKDNVNTNPGGNSRLGCGAWDYSCHTYIHDSSRVDSILNFTPDYIISNFSGSNYSYSINPIYNLHHYIQYHAIVDSIISEDTISSIQADTNNIGLFFFNHHKRQYLYTHLNNQSDTLTALKLFTNPNLAGDTSIFINDFRIRLKATQDSFLLKNDPHLDGFTEVYYSDTQYDSDSTFDHRFQFYQPFVLDSGMNLIVEFSSNKVNDHLAHWYPGLLAETAPDSANLYSTSHIQSAYIELNSAEHVTIPSTNLGMISDEITISLWVNGDENVLPANTTLFEALDSNGNRTMNVHFPWSNGRIYWDCGNSGSSYDRIDKAASLSEYAGKWNHWTFTKNANTGEMKIYLNGSLWHSATGKTRLINIDSFTLGSNGVGNGYFWDGKILDLNIFKKELSALEIQSVMYELIDSSHPLWLEIADQYLFNSDPHTYQINTGSSTGSGAAIFNGYVSEKTIEGVNHFTYFEHSFSDRPFIDFYSGDYLLSVVNDTVTDSLQAIPNVVTKREVFPNYSTALDDSIGIVSIDTLWEAIQYEYIYDTSGVATNTYTTIIDSTLLISDLNYYKRYPMLFQIMSFVTPYGMGVDFGENGKSWYFDVTDYSPILKGSKRMTMSGGGQWQEDMDIKFYFIVGTPPRDVLDMQQIWRPQSKGYATIMADDVFESRSHKFRSDATAFKLRSMITGHGQEGEFVPRIHYLNVNASNPPTHSWQVWTACAGNPVYPQGGTWIYNRAGWCPGQATDLKEYDITSLVTPGQIHILDYGINTASGSSNYWVNNQLVSYGDPNFTLDAAIIEVLSPTNQILHSRKNPVCSKPKIVIQNTGQNTLTNLRIEYWVNSASNPEVYQWTGSLDFLEKEEIELPAPNSLWNNIDYSAGVALGDVITYENNPSLNKFHVNISQPNGASDAYMYNNSISSTFTPAPNYPNIFTFWYTTNSGVTNSLTQESETTWDIIDNQGAPVYQSGPLVSNTQYKDTLSFVDGCYTLRVIDVDNDGLDFWNNNDGGGMLRFRRLTPFVDTTNIPWTYHNWFNTMELDFGSFIHHEFTASSQSTSINEQEGVFNIFPNPATDKLMIHADLKSKTLITLKDQLGRIVYSENMEQGVIKITIDLSDYSNGIYLLNAFSKDSRITKKIIKH